MSTLLIRQAHTLATLNDAGEELHHLGESCRRQLGRQCGDGCSGQNVGGGFDLGDGGTGVARAVVGDGEADGEPHPCGNRLR